jgi:hypothetical protein
MTLRAQAFGRAPLLLFNLGWPSSAITLSVTLVELLSSLIILLKIAANFGKWKKMENGMENGRKFWKMEKNYCQL